MKKYCLYILFFCLMTISSTAVMAQQKTDTLIINVGTSRIIFLINDRKDLDKIENYDLNAILKNLKLKLENDSTLVTDNGDEETSVQDTTVNLSDISEERWSNEDERSSDDWDWERNRRNKSWGVKVGKREESRKSFHRFNFDLGTNNYLSDGKFPSESNESFAVRPWGSWYVGVNSTTTTNIKGHLSLEWGAGVSWYNFKFQNDRIRVGEIAGVTSFVEDPDPTIDYKKSKLTASYINFTAVPIMQFNRTRVIRRNYGWNDIKFGSSDAGFRIGIGGYAGYRLGSHSKVKFESGKKDKDNNDFNLTNFRYGIRVQMGFGGTDLFFNYDLNELFATDKGPKLNAFSFGIIL